MMCLQYSPSNTLNIVGISITLPPHINMQHAAVSYETLHNCLYLFNIAQPIRMLQTATTASVALCSVDVDIFSKKCNVRRHIELVRISTAVMKELRTYDYNCSCTYYCLNYAVCKAHAPYDIVISELSGYTKKFERYYIQTTIFVKTT